MKKKIIYIGLATVLLGTLIFQTLSGKKADTKEIVSLLTKELNYTDITTMSVNGFLASEGIYGDSHLVTVSKSNLTSINKNEALKIQKIFYEKLNHFSEADYIELSFSNIKSKGNKIIFKRGKIINL